MAKYTCPNIPLPRERITLKSFIFGLLTLLEEPILFNSAEDDLFGESPIMSAGYIVLQLVIFFILKS